MPTGWTMKAKNPYANEYGTQPSFYVEESHFGRRPSFRLQSTKLSFFLKTLGSMYGGFL